MNGVRLFLVPRYAGAVLRWRVLALVSPPKEFEGVRLESERSIKHLVGRLGDLEAEEVDRLTRLLASAFPSK